MQISRKKVGIGIGLSIAVLAGLGWLKWSARFEDTDNAYTSAHVATLSAKVGGLVTEVLVEENFKVKKDQILVRLDARDYQHALARLRSELSALDASLALARKDNQRLVKLFASEAVAAQDRDAGATKVQELKSRRDALNAQIADATLNLEFTEIRAPADGTIGKKLVEPGMVVAIGQPLLAFVDGQTPWIVANFKETQLRRLKVGLKTDIEIDSIGGKTFRGTVESFSPGTGAIFALIPPENATGNFTKIVQRLPVRIRFDPESIKGFEDRIVPGLSAEATVELQTDTNLVSGLSTEAQAAADHH